MPPGLPTAEISLFTIHISFVLKVALKKPKGKENLRYKSFLIPLFCACFYCKGG